MKKSLKSFILPVFIFAVTFTNPATDFLIDYGSGNTFDNLLVKFINLTLGIVGLLSVFFIIVGGLRYITSGGNEEAAASGKKTFINAIIGLVIVIFSYVAVVVVIRLLQGHP